MLPGQRASQLSRGALVADLTEETSPAQFEFVRHGDSATSSVSWERGPEQVRKAIGEALNARNVAFLLGAGCSSFVLDKQERGISTMAPLAKEFCKHPSCAQDLDDDLNLIPTPDWALDQADIDFLEAVGASLSDTEYSCNLERLMELLHSLRFIYERSNKPKHTENGAKVESIIKKVQDFLWDRCTNGAFAKGDSTVLDLYETFYRKLVLRDRSLPRPWVFTTNYDLFNERSGVVERRFNPATFRYALAEQLDLTNRKWSAVDGFVYLCKLHGSISWTEDDHGLFPVRELWPQDEPTKVMIYPTPAKQNSSLGSPYADLFREFQSRIVREQSVLITAGFAFGDEHLNHIIYQALTIPTFRLIIFADPASGGEIEKLRKLNDPRIWIIGGDGPEEGTRAHYFSTIIEHFLPQRPLERIDDAVKLVLEKMGPTKGDDSEL